MYMIEEEKNKLIDTVSRYGAVAVTALAEQTGEEANHPNTYAAGYMQGYAHAIDQACDIINHCGDIK